MAVFAVLQCLTYRRACGAERIRLLVVYESHSVAMPAAQIPWFVRVKLFSQASAGLVRAARARIRIVFEIVTG